MSPNLPFLGKWQLVESENFEDFMKELGVGLLLRKAAVHLKPTLEIYIDEKGVWHMDQLSTFKNHFVDFELDKEAEKTAPDGRAVLTTFWLEGDHLKQKDIKVKPSDKDSRMERYVDAEGHLIEILEVGSVVCRRVYVPV